ncbi:MAG TPA: DUF5919 domain-containing protein [Fimbriimonadaceae bacterium]|nr:DUF5919 domain-containing protein [Fimbriimonadaceae bacterium]
MQSLILIGQIVAPATLVALITMLFGLPDQLQALFSLCSIVIAYTLLRKDAIDKRIQSSYLVIIGFLFTAVFAFTYREVLFKDTGLIRFFKDSSAAQPEIEKTIEGSKQELWMFGSNFHKSLNDYQPLFLDKLRDGVNIYVLVQNPNSPIFDSIATDFGQTSEELRSECRNSLSYAMKIVNFSKNNRYLGQFEIRFHDSFPRLRAYFADPNDESGVSILVPHMNEVDSPKLPVYLFKNTKAGVARSYYRGLRQLWERSLKLDAFLLKNPNFISTANQ